MRWRWHRTPRWAGCRSDSGSRWASCAGTALFRLACEYLLSSRVIRPGVILLLRRVAAARTRARTETWTRVKHLLTDRRCAELDLLLVPDAYLGRTPLAWLGVGPTSSSAGAGAGG